MSATRWPNLFIVGAAKAGTTALYHYLGSHPDIFMSPIKEPRFFAPVPWLPSVKTVDAYLDLFSAARDQRFRGEGSVSYLLPEHVPEAIHGKSPDASIVISVREPVDLCHTLYLQWALLSGRERRDFQQAIRDEVFEGIEYSDRDSYVNAATYTPPIERYLATFGERVFVLFFEELVANTHAVLRGLYEFLGVDPGPADRLEPRPYNQFVVGRNRATRRLIGITRRLAPRPLRSPIVRALVSSPPKPEPDPESVEILRRAFEPDVIALRDLLGRPLPEAWQRRFPAVAQPPIAG